MSTHNVIATRWHYPTAVRFGVGVVREIAEHCAAFGITKPLVVTDEGLKEAAFITTVLEDLKGLGAALFSDVQGNPVGQNVDDGVAMFRAGAHDGVVAVGGGSGIDVGKAIALMAGQDRPMWDFEDVGDNYLRVNEDGMRPCIAIPTTAGTGSEVGRSSVITHEAEARKVIIFHAKMMPVLALCDPAVTVSLPAKLTGATGMDALSHNLEAYCANGNHPLSDGIAVEGIRLTQEHLSTATHAPSDLDARAGMLAASLMGATAFQKGLGAMHALSHPIGVHLHQHHGLINAVMMPYVLCYNRTYIESRISRLAGYMGLDGFDGFLNWVLDVRKDVFIPHDGGALGLKSEHIEQFSTMAEGDPAGFGNPIKMTADRYADLYRHVLDGKMPAAASR